MIPVIRGVRTPKFNYFSELRKLYSIRMTHQYYITGTVLTFFKLY